MQVKFLKKHLDWRQGEDAEIEDPMARYMLSVGLVELAKQDHKKTEQILLNHLTKEKKPKKK